MVKANVLAHIVLNVQEVLKSSFTKNNIDSNFVYSKSPHKTENTSKKKLGGTGCGVREVTLYHRYRSSDGRPSTSAKKRAWKRLNYGDERQRRRHHGKGGTQHRPPSGIRWLCLYKLQISSRSTVHGSAGTYSSGISQFWAPLGFFLIRLSGTAPRCVVLELGHLPNSHPQKENGNCGISRGGTTTTFPPTFPSPSAPDCGDSRDTINSATTTCKPLWPPHNSSHRRTHTHTILATEFRFFTQLLPSDQNTWHRFPFFTTPPCSAALQQRWKITFLKPSQKERTRTNRRRKKFHYQVISLAFFSFLHRDGIMHFALAPILQHCFSLRGLFFQTHTPSSRLVRRTTTGLLTVCAKRAGDFPVRFCPVSVSLARVCTVPVLPCFSSPLLTLPASVVVVVVGWLGGDITRRHRQEEF